MNRDIDADEKVSVELDARSVELLTGVTLQYGEQGDPSGVPVLPLHDCIEGGERDARDLLLRPQR